MTNPKAKQSVSESVDNVFNLTYRSTLYNYLRVLDENNRLRVGDQLSSLSSLGYYYNKLALYKSQSVVYNTVETINPSLFKRQFTESEILAFKESITHFIDLYFRNEFAESEREYFQITYPHPRGYYYCNLLADEFQTYGINKGFKSDNYNELFNRGVNIFLNQIDFSKLNNVKSVYNAEVQSLCSNFDNYKGNSGEVWDELLVLCPYLDIIDQRKKSGFPFYDIQDKEHIIGVCADISDLSNKPESKVGTMYFRTQGGKWINLVKNIIKWKIRPVIGSTSVVKVDGAPITYVFKESAPYSCPYYKDANDVMETKVLPSFIKAFNEPNDLMAFTSDISKCDQSHTNVNMKPVIDNIFKRINAQCSSVDVNTLSKMIRDCIDSMLAPVVVFNCAQAQVGEKDVYKSLSGNPAVPLIQTTSVSACHLVCSAEQYYGNNIEKVKGDSLDEFLKLVIMMQDQIDDYYYCGPRIDHVEMGKSITANYGLEINTSKMETGDKGYIIMLKIACGDLYNEKGKKELVLLDRSTPDFSILGVIGSKFKGFFDKERGNADDGTPLFFVELSEVDESDEFVNFTKVEAINGKRYVPVEKEVQQLLGVIMSFGRKIPIQLLDIIEYHFRGKPVWNKLLMLAQCVTHVIMKKQEYGMSDYTILLEYLAKSYKITKKVI